MDNIVTPAIKFMGSIGGTVRKFKKRMVNLMAVGQFMQPLTARKDRFDLSLERFSEYTVDVVIAVVDKDKSTVTDVTAKVLALFFGKANQFVSSKIEEWESKDFFTVQVDDNLFGIDPNTGVFDQ